MNKEIQQRLQWGKLYEERGGVSPLRYICTVMVIT